MLKFSEWLNIQEDGCPAAATTTASVAGFARPVFSSPISWSSMFPRRKKRKHLKEFVDNDINNVIKTVVDPEQFSVFFIWKGDVYGASENSRVIISNMLRPNEDMVDMPRFIGSNLSTINIGKQPYPRVFLKKDLPNIKIISDQEAMKILSNGRK